MKTKTSSITWKITVFSVIAGLSISSYLIAKNTDNKIVIATDSRPIDRSVQGASFAPMLEQATQSVVSVHTAELVRSASSNGQTLDELFLRRFFGQPAPNQPRQRNQPSTQPERTIPQGVGSGVIISNDGYIMTNNHVVQDSNGGDADEIIVRLFDDKELKAKLIGRDPKTDIAIIKVDAKDLPAAKIADSDQIKVGDKVFAIGNPLGIGMTVTSGIISAKNRSIGIYGNDGYENFIQTDASINQGNSGGALVDIEGRLIGINSAIVSRNGGSVGLGFSIPTNLATNIAEQLTTSGKVRRGIIGVRISPLDAEIAEALGVKGTKGVLVEQVEAGWPAEKAGIKHGDIITHIDGNLVDTPAKLRLSIAKVSPGETLKVKIKRGSKELEKTVTVKDPSALAQNSLNLFPGTKILPINNELREKYNLPPNLGGVVIDQINRDSALNGRIATGTVIMEINRHSVNSIEDLGKHFKKNAANLLYIYHRGRASYIAYHD